MDNEFFDFDKVIEIEKEKSYNQALKDFAERILNWESQDEEYRSFRDVVTEIKEQLKR